jgi:hypothetical protein
MYRKLKWTNKKFKSRIYEGFYRRVNTEREFILVCFEKSHTISFESHEAATALGWVGK